MALGRCARTRLRASKSAEGCRDQSLRTPEANVVALTEVGGQGLFGPEVHDVAEPVRAYQLLNLLRTEETDEWFAHLRGDARQHCVDLRSDPQELVPRLVVREDEPASPSALGHGVQ